MAVCSRIELEPFIGSVERCTIQLEERHFSWLRTDIWCESPFANGFPSRGHDDLEVGDKAGFHVLSCC